MRVSRCHEDLQSLPPILQKLHSRVGAPLFIISNPDLVIAQCTAGVVGSFPALNARPAEADKWLVRVKEALKRHDDAIAHRRLPSRSIRSSTAPTTASTTSMLA